MAYGGMQNGIANPDVLYVGAGSTLFLRTTAGGSVSPLTGYPGSDLVDIGLAPADWTTVYVVDPSDVYRSVDAGQSWIPITGNLPLTGLQTIAVIERSADDLVVVGGVAGVYAASSSDPTVWSAFGGNLPNVVVMDLVYDAVDDVLAAATLGRGAWILEGAARP